MSKRSYEVVISLLVVANMAFALYVGLLWTGHFGDDAVSQASASPPAPMVVAPPPLTPEPPPAPPPVVRPAPSRAVAAKPALLVTIKASRGSCWFSAHRRSATGSVLAERTLAEGETASLRGRRIWLELGAAGNVDITVNGRPRPVASGTTELVLG